MSITAITCPNCGGSLKVFGGGRQVATFTCNYCGSVLDVENNYKVLDKFTRVKLPPSPFSLGMRGVIDEITFTIIGMVAYSCERGKSVGVDTWIDYMLYSPTHGYAWLTYEEGNLTFSRRTRKMPALNISRMTPQETFSFDGRYYEFYEGYRAYITFVQGELTWVARKDDAVMIYEAISPPLGLSYERSGSESEYYISHYLDTKEVCDSFGATCHKSNAMNPLKPFVAERSKAFSKASAIFAVLSLLMIGIIEFSFNGTLIKSESFVGKTKEIPFHIEDPRHLIALKLKSDVNNDWIYYDISVIKSDTQEEVYSLGKELSYYYGYEGGESWSEGSQEVMSYFKLKEPGDYLLKFNAPQYHRTVHMNVSIREDVIRSLYFVILFIFSFLGSFVYLIQYGIYKTNLWKHIEEEDDD